MILEKGNMWDVFGKTDLFMITTNPIIRKDGAVVMGRGIALEAKTRYPSLPYDFGKQLTLYKDASPAARSRFVGTIGVYDSQFVGYFMVKDHYRNHADLGLITLSTLNLLEGATLNSNDRVDLNFPGIGNGKLKREDVLPIIEQLPDNVHVWEFE